MNEPAYRRRDLAALLAVAIAIALVVLYRSVGVNPRYWSAACIAAHPPLGCTPRAAVMWLQGRGLWGWAALILGLAAFATRCFVLFPLAIALGATAIINFNAGFGMLGAALGAWTWLGIRK